jgi:hypothetical protein
MNAVDLASFLTDEAWVEVKLSHLSEAEEVELQAY